MIGFTIVYLICQWAMISVSRDAVEDKAWIISESGRIDTRMTDADDSMMVMEKRRSNRQFAHIRKTCCLARHHIFPQNTNKLVMVYPNEPCWLHPSSDSAKSHVSFRATMFSLRGCSRAEWGKGFQFAFVLKKKMNVPTKQHVTTFLMLELLIDFVSMELIP